MTSRSGNMWSPGQCRRHPVARSPPPTERRETKIRVVGCFFRSVCSTWLTHSERRRAVKVKWQGTGSLTQTSARSRPGMDNKDNKAKADPVSEAMVANHCLHWGTMITTGPPPPYAWVTPGAALAASVKPGRGARQARSCHSCRPGQVTTVSHTFNKEDNHNEDNNNQNKNKYINNRDKHSTRQTEANKIYMVDQELIGTLWANFPFQVHFPIYV